MPKLADRVQETSTTTGTGTLTLAGAKTGFQAFSAIGDGEKCFYVIQHQSAAEWETGIGTYTSSGTTLSRDEVISSSNSDSAVDLSAGTKDVFVSLPSTQLEVWPGANPYRLSLETGVSVSTSDQSAKTTLYAAMHNGAGDKIALFDGSGWRYHTASELSITNSSVTTSKPHDVFVYDNSGTLTLEFTAWTDATTRATSLAVQNGVLLKTGALTRRYIGTVYVDASDQFNDTAAKREVFNADNQLLRPAHLFVGDGHTYNGGTRSYNNDTGNRVTFVIGLAQEFEIAVGGHVVAPSGNDAYAAIAAGTNTTSSFDNPGAFARNSYRGHVGEGAHMKSLAAGYHYVQIVETSYSTGTATFTNGILLVHVKN